MPPGRRFDSGSRNQVSFHAGLLPGFRSFYRQCPLDAWMPGRGPERRARRTGHFFILNPTTHHALRKHLLRRRGGFARLGAARLDAGVPRRGRAVPLRAPAAALGRDAAPAAARRLGSRRRQGPTPAQEVGQGNRPAPEDRLGPEPRRLHQDPTRRLRWTNRPARRRNALPIVQHRRPPRRALRPAREPHARVYSPGLSHKRPLGGLGKRAGRPYKRRQGKRFCRFPIAPRRMGGQAPQGRMAQVRNRHQRPGMLRRGVASA